MFADDISAVHQSGAVQRHVFATSSSRRVVARLKRTGFLAIYFRNALQLSMVEIA